MPIAGQAFLEDIVRDRELVLQQTAHQKELTALTWASLQPTSKACAALKKLLGAVGGVDEKKENRISLKQFLPHAKVTFAGGETPASPDESGADADKGKSKGKGKAKPEGQDKKRKRTSRNKQVKVEELLPKVLSLHTTKEEIEDLLSPLPVANAVTQAKIANGDFVRKAFQMLAAAIADGGFAALDRLGLTGPEGDNTVKLACERFGADFADILSANNGHNLGKLVSLTSKRLAALDSGD